MEPFLSKAGAAERRHQRWSTLLSSRCFRAMLRQLLH